MKIIAVDNYNRETVADRLIASEVSPYYASFLASSLQAAYGGDESDDYYKVVPDDYVLWRGMEELI